MTTKEQVIELAKQAGIDDWWESGNERREELDDLLTIFATLVRNAALDEAAQVISNWPVKNWKQDDCAQAIRNLKEPV